MFHISTMFKSETHLLSVELMRERPRGKYRKFLPDIRLHCCHDHSYSFQFQQLSLFFIFCVICISSPFLIWRIHAITKNLKANYVTA